MGFATNYLPLSGLHSGGNENGTANVIELSAGKNATSIASTWIIDSATNRSQHFRDLMRKDFVFDRTDVRVMFISLYSLVFCCCFCGMWHLHFPEFKHSIYVMAWYKHTHTHTLKPLHNLTLCTHSFVHIKIAQMMGRGLKCFFCWNSIFFFRFHLKEI